jgi:hypothetical protein
MGGSGWVAAADSGLVPARLEKGQDPASEGLLDEEKGADDVWNTCWRVSASGAVARPTIASALGMPAVVLRPSEEIDSILTEQGERAEGCARAGELDCDRLQHRPRGPGAKSVCSCGCRQRLTTESPPPNLRPGSVASPNHSECSICRAPLRPPATVTHL